jgi:selenophosphate synthase
MLHDVITVNDHALTRLWTVDKHYKRDHNPIWFDNNCAEDNRHVWIGKEHYVISGDDFLMPAKKDQAPPDLRYFKQPRK